MSLQLPHCSPTRDSTGRNTGALTPSPDTLKALPCLAWDSLLSASLFGELRQGRSLASPVGQGTGEDN